ncbi:MAG TPA: sn-glycerol-1-phosphate dehydrogenase [Ruminiclostridium sp.]
MININDIKISELAGYSFDCNCGKKHSVDIKKISIGSEIYRELPDLLKEYKDKKIFVIADANTYQVYGKKVFQTLENEGFILAAHVFESKTNLIPNEEAIGRLVVEIENDVAMIIAVGSGTINDISRIISYKFDIPYIIVATAPSMDGYASTVSPLIINGFKKTYEAVYPYAILADMDIIKEAPKGMICAGFGDILGKYTALSDWQLSKNINDEYHCETCVEIVRCAIKKCVDNAQGIANRDAQAISYLMEALILSGVVMGMVGNSRPASGAEHHLSHYWEIDAIAKGIKHPLHGNSVGVGTVVISRIYDIVKAKYRIDFVTPDPKDIINLLKSAGCCYNPKDLGIEKEVFRSSILHAKEIRPRYTILHLAQELRILEQAADEITELYYE